MLTYIGKNEPNSAINICYKDLSIDLRTFRLMTWTTLHSALELKRLATFISGQQCLLSLEALVVWLCWTMLPTECNVITYQSVPVAPLP